MAASPTPGRAATSPTPSRGSTLAPPRKVDHSVPYSSFPEQAPLAGPEMIYVTIFDVSTVHQLRSSDFVLGEEDPAKRINLIWKNCMMVLFYGENEESKTIMRAFGSASRQSPGVKFGACNLFYEKEVAGAFVQLASIRDSEWAALQGYPFVLTYQMGRPVGFYNGPREVQALVDFSLTLACKSTYSERVQLAAGAQSEANYQMPPYDPYGRDPTGKANPKLTQSSEFRAGESVRGYDPNLGLAYSGSPAAIEAGRILTAAEEERAKRGGVLFPPAVESTSPAPERSRVVPPTGTRSAVGGGPQVVPPR